MKLEQATPADAFWLAQLRDDAARWQRELGIDQWTPGGVSPDTFEEQAAAGEWYLVRDGETAGAVRLLRADPMFWDEQPDVPALYVHGLVRGRTAPKGTGAELLRWAEEQAVQAQCRVVRLDCVDSNLPLCRYYEDQGYVRVGHRSFRSTAAALYQKAVGGQ